MPRLIKNGQLEADNWQRLSTSDDQESVDISSDNWILPAATFLELKNSGQDMTRYAVLLPLDTAEETLGEFTDSPLICIDFHSFMDGRGFTLGRSLREHLDYQGELRATGNFIQDQLYYLARCGFNSFELGEAISVDSALTSLKDFSISYQAAIDEPQPLFRRRK